ncbi:condensin subunit ScpB [Anaerolinea thermolimosa]|nr:condensin subunit ScpB [Anaerolinea thermolimosa]
MDGIDSVCERSNYSMSENNPTDPQTYLGILEALLFVAPEPVHPQQLAEVLSLSVTDVETYLRALDEEYQNGRGLRIQWHAGRVQLTTAPQFSETIERFLGLEATARLSRAALETLAIIAYRQPVTRPAIDAVRGVNSDGVVKSLLGKGLIQEVGRADSPGRPILYGTTGEFLQYFGLGSIQDLPPYDVPSEDELPTAENGILKD